MRPGILTFLLEVLLFITREAFQWTVFLPNLNFNGGKLKSGTLWLKHTKEKTFKLIRNEKFVYV